jgi:hypothetical protein
VFFLGGTACDAGETPVVHPKEVGDGDYII